MTHDQEEALELAHQIVLMHQGRVEQIGTSEEIYNQPATPFVASFVGAANVLQGIVINGRVQFGEQLVAGADHLPDGVSAHAYVRPHDIRIASIRSNGHSSSAIVERMTNLGWTTKVNLSLSDGQALIAQLPNEHLTGIDQGARVFVDLHNAKVFAPQGVERHRSDELAAV
ncbi:MAG: TOBE domain-containing protein [Actinomycetota bacterium]